MNAWIWLVVALAVGLVLLGAALLADRARERRREGAGAAPSRGLESVDAIIPRYVTQSEIDALPLPAGPPIAEPGTKGSRLPFGHSGPEFATDGDRAILRDARILMVDGDVTAMREVMAVLPGREGDPALVIAATGLGGDVLAGLKANRRALRMPIVAATPSRRDLYELRQIVGGEVLGIADLRAGYVPDEALGRAALWVSDGSATRVEP